MDENHVIVGAVCTFDPGFPERLPVWGEPDQYISGVSVAPNGSLLVALSNRMSSRGPDTSKLRAQFIFLWDRNFRMEEMDDDTVHRSRSKFLRVRTGIGDILRVPADALKKIIVELEEKEVV